MLSRKALITSFSPGSSLKAVVNIQNSETILQRSAMGQHVALHLKTIVRIEQYGIRRQQQRGFRFPDQGIYTNRLVAAGSAGGGFAEKIAHHRIVRIIPMETI